MRYLLTAKQAKMADAYSMEEMGIPSMVLMERAALAVAEAVQKEADREEPILAVCGVGNNGADGVAAARILYLRGYRAGALLVGNPEKGSRELKAQVEIARKLGMEIACCSGEQEIPEPEGMIIDAMFGVGLARAVEGVPGQWVERVNRLRESGKVRRVIAVDLPSGIDGDRGTVMGRAVKADLTVTFGWEKRGSVLYPGRAYSGTVITAEIGFPRKALEQLEEEPACTYGQEDLWRVAGPLI